MAVPRFAHLYDHPDRLEVYRQSGPDWTTPVVTQLARRPGVTTLLQAATAALRARGWRPGVDGWRRPLAPDSSILATAQLVPRGD